MKRLVVGLVVMALMAGLASAGKKELPPPSEGKAVVYIGRMTGMVGAIRPFHFFADEEYLGPVRGKNYVRYECDPGEHVFWVAADARNFVKADLEAGRSYALWAKITAGTWSAGAALIPIVPESKAWKEFNKMIRKSKPNKIKPEDIARWTEGHPTYIEDVLAEWRAAGEPAVTMRADEYFD